MKHGGHLRRALFLAAALAIAGQARALGASSGQGTGTGGPQTAYAQHVAPGSPVSTSQRGADGVPTWYAVDTSPRPPAARGPVMLVQRSLAVPSWYAID